MNSLGMTVPLYSGRPFAALATLLSHSPSLVLELAGDKYLLQSILQLAICTVLCHFPSSPKQALLTLSYMISRRLISI